MTPVLQAFHPAVRTWFERRFPHGPTEPQAAAWPHIRSGADVLVASPTGTGKTLTGFLVAIDAALRRTASAGGPEVVYISPLRALAADVHGKNHHRDGSICRHVTELTLVTPGGTHVVAPDRDAELFWATGGGMGLTGVVTRAAFRLLPVETTWMRVDTERFADLDGVMAAMEEGDARYRYSVAWVDCTAGGRRAPATRGPERGRPGRAAPRPPGSPPRRGAPTWPSTS